MSFPPRSQMPRRGMPTAPEFLGTDELSGEPIQVEGLNGRASHRAETHHEDAVPPEVQPPRITARVEQRSCLAAERVGGTCPPAFAEGTRNAGQREISQRRCASSMDWDYVVNVEGRFLASLGKPAVFTARLRPVDDLAPQLRRDGHAIRTGYRSNGAPAASGTRACQRARRVLLLPASRLGSTRNHRPACPAGRGAASARLWATGTAPDRPATQASLRWPSAYVIAVTLGEFAGRQPACPRPAGTKL